MFQRQAPSVAAIPPTSYPPSMTHRRISVIRLALIVCTLLILTTSLPVPLLLPPMADAAVSLAGAVDFSYGTFTSEYIQLMSDSHISWFDAVDVCKEWGDGWDIGGTYSAAGNAAVTTMKGTVTGPLFGLISPIGLSYNTQNFLWAGGRFRGKIVSTGLSPNAASYNGAYVNWRSGQPDAAVHTGCAAESNGLQYGERVGVIYSNGDWNDIHPTYCSWYTHQYVICERSVCTVAADCVEANSISVSATYSPNCTCVCKTGYKGLRCQMPNVTTVVLSDVEYTVGCERTRMTPDEAQGRCEALGSGWALASIPSSTVQAALANFTPDNIWTGGSYNSTSTYYEWGYGRLAGVPFSYSGGTCYGSAFCDWSLPWEPNRRDCTDGRPLQKDVEIQATEYSATRKWNDMWVDGCGIWPGYNVTCYACERSPCVASDCGKGYTRLQPSYYPQCNCSTISATLSLSTSDTHTSTGTDTSSVVVSQSISENYTTTVSIATSPSTSITATGMTASLLATASTPRTLSTSLTPTSPHTLSVTPSRSMPVSTTLSYPVSVTTTPSRSVPATTTPTKPQTPTPTTTLTPLATRSFTQTHLTPSKTSSRTPPLTSTPSPPPTTTRTATPSIPATATPSAASTATMAHVPTSTPTHVVNTALVSALVANLPLFEPVVLFDSAVRSGSVTSIPLADGKALWEGLGGGGTNRPVPIVFTLPSLGLVGVTGNVKGFFNTMPNVTVTLLNDTMATLSLSPLPGYAIDVSERLLLYTTLGSLLDTSAVVPTDGTLALDTLLLVGTVVVSVPEGVMSAPSVAAAAVGSLMASEVSALGALALMGCADPSTRSRFGSYRVLSPVAVQESYAGVIMGNVVLVGVVSLIQAAILCVLRIRRSVQRMVDLMAAARFPSLTIIATLLFHTGTSFAAAQLISQPSKYDEWEVVVGGIGFILCLLMPLAMCAHPYLRVGRAYQTTDLPAWLAVRGWPAWMAVVLPHGAIYSSETRRAYGPYISAYRSPATQVWWTSMPTWTPIVFLVAGLLHPETVPLCQALYACMGAVMFALAGVVLWQRPLQSNASCFLDATSRILLGCTMLCMAAALVSDSTSNDIASTAAFVCGVLLMCVAVLRFSHMLLCTYALHRMDVDGCELSVVWTHVPGSSRKVTQVFTAMDDELLGIAGSRDDKEGDEELQPMIHSDEGSSLSVEEDLSSSSSSTITMDTEGGGSDDKKQSASRSEDGSKDGGSDDLSHTPPSPNDDDSHSTFTSSTSSLSSSTTIDLSSSNSL